MSETPRYQVEFGLDSDEHPGTAAFYPDTVGIVDNAQGGVIAYCHVESAERIILALYARDRLEDTLNETKED